MKILYISHLSTNIAAGLNWSVPASVKAQAKIDEVLWINMTDKLMEHWNNVPVYHNIHDFGGKLKLHFLPEPFNHPDVVVFEGFYYMDDVRFAKELRNFGVPYIIVPRSSLTQLALHNHAWFKKWVAHKIYFDKFVKHATAIQYLTRQEADDSTGHFKTPFFIVPNGFDTPKESKFSFFDSGIKATFIGRLDMYQKGLDILLDAMTDLQDELQKAKFTIDLYGPKRYDYYKIQDEINNRGISNIVNLHDEVAGEGKKNVLLNTDLFVMPSRFEGHPMGLIEALAYGIPSLVTPGTNMAKEIGLLNAGWVCEGNVECIKQTILTTIAEKELFFTKSRQAQLLARQYNWDIIARCFHDEVSQFVNRVS